jgi:hypothetical protein
MTDRSLPQPSSGRPALMALAWLWVGAPFAYGVYELVQKVVQLFSS